jgi:hypothetical protein
MVKNKYSEKDMIMTKSIYHNQHGFNFLRKDSIL